MKISKIAIILIVMVAVQFSGKTLPAEGPDDDSFVESLNENIRNKPSSLLGGLTGTEFMHKMKEKYGREKTVALFSVMSARAEFSEEKAGEASAFITPEMADDLISFYTMAVREADAGFAAPDDLAAKKIVALMYNELAAKYLAGDKATVEFCQKNFGDNAKAKMITIMRITTIFLENS